MLICVFESRLPCHKSRLPHLKPHLHRLGSRLHRPRSGLLHSWLHLHSYRFRPTLAQVKPMPTQVSPRSHRFRHRSKLVRLESSSIQLTTRACTAGSNRSSREFHSFGGSCRCRDWMFGLRLPLQAYYEDGRITSGEGIHG